MSRAAAQRGAYCEKFEARITDGDGKASCDGSSAARAEGALTAEDECEVVDGVKEAAASRETSVASTCVHDERASAGVLPCKTPENATRFCFGGETKDMWRDC